MELFCILIVVVFTWIHKDRIDQKVSFIVHQFKRKYIVFLCMRISCFLPLLSHTLPLDFRIYFIYLTEMHCAGLGKTDIFGFIPQMVAKVRAGSVQTQEHGTPSCLPHDWQRTKHWPCSEAFPATLAGNYIGSGAVGTWTSAWIWEDGVAA